MSAAELEPLLLDAWPARERATCNGWALRADGGVTGRANCVTPLAFTGVDLAQAIDAAVAWQRARGTRPCFRIADALCAPDDLPARLAARGWTAQMRTLVMTAPLAAARPPLPEPDRDVQLAADFPPAIDAIIRETAASTAEHAERAGITSRTPQPRRFALVGEADAVAAAGLCVVTGAWAGIFLMRTHPAHRRQGLARRILAALLAWGESAGARNAFLQVEADNGPGVALYRACAFETAYSYSYWRPETGQ